MNEAFTGVERASPYTDYAQKILDDFNEVHRAAPDKNLRAREDVLEIVDSFASKNFEGIEDMVLLVDVFDRLNNEVVNSNVRRILVRSNFGDISNRDFVSIDEGNIERLHIAHGFNELNNCVSKRLDRQDNFAPTDKNVFEALNSNQPISKEIWLSDHILPNLHQLDDLTERVHPKTILIKAAQILSTLQSEYQTAIDPSGLDNTIDDTTLFRSIAAAEAVYVPLLEVMEYEAFAATLMDYVNRVRLVKSGRSDLIERAQNIRNSVGAPNGINALARCLPGKIFGQDYTKPLIPQENQLSADAAFLTGFVGESDPDETYYMSGRIKTLGSIARKLLLQERSGSIAQNDDEDIYKTPADVIGYTIVCSDEEAVAKAFLKAVSNLRQLPGFEYYAAPSRTQAFHAKGGAEFCDQIFKALLQDPVLSNERSRDFVDRKVGDDLYEVAKFTFKLPIADGDTSASKVPIEIQCVTESNHAEGKHGKHAHTLFKLAKYALAKPQQTITPGSPLSPEEENKNYFKSDKAVEHLTNIYKRAKGMAAGKQYDAGYQASLDPARKMYSTLRQVYRFIGAPAANTVH